MPGHGLHYNVSQMVLLSCKGSRVVVSLKSNRVRSEESVLQSFNCKPRWAMFSKIAGYGGCP